MYYHASTQKKVSLNKIPVSESCFSVLQLSWWMAAVDLVMKLHAQAPQHKVQEVSSWMIGMQEAPLPTAHKLRLFTPQP